MDLRSKLGLYKENNTRPEEKKAGTGAEKVFPGSIVCENEEGSYLLLEQRFPVSYIYGGYGLGEALLASFSSVQKLACTDSVTASPADLLFLDTETTGLSGGTGTVAFLIGTGYFEENSFVMRQYFMRDYDEEPAVLKALNESLSRFKGLITFNGKSFDWNLLQSRYTFNRMKPHKRDPFNLDLLFPARRIWGLKLESCSLTSLEENILSEFRAGDIPGALIPSIYFKYLEDRETSDIIKVIKHNELDILAMVALIRKMSLMLEMPFSEEHGDYERLGLGKIFEFCGELDNSIDCFESCSRSDSITVRSASVKKLTKYYKKNGDFEKALAHWQQTSGEQGGLSLFSLVEMAKYYEHREKDISKAMCIVEKALEMCRKTGLDNKSCRDDLVKRRERLKRKAERIS